MTTFPELPELAQVGTEVARYSQGEIEPPPWKITGLGAAEWAIRKVAEKQALIDQLKAQHAEWADQIDGWLASSARPLEREVEFFEGHLKRYALERRERHETMKSVPLPSGVVQTRAGRQSVEITDMDALLASVDGLGLGGDIVKREVRKSELVKVCEVHRYQVVTLKDAGVLGGFDLGLEVGDTFLYDSDTGEMAEVVDVTEDRLVLTYGEEQIILDGVTVSQSDPTASVSIRGKAQ